MEYDWLTEPTPTPKPPRRHPRPLPRSIGRLMTVVALSALAFGALSPGRAIPPGTVRRLPRGVAIPTLLVPGAATIDDRFLHPAPRGIDDRFLVPAPVGIDERMIHSPVRVPRQALPLSPVPWLGPGLP